MSKADLALISIGNALVDMLAQTDDDYLARQNMDKGAMMLVDSDRALALYSDMDNPTEMAGGSAGNTMACFASLGGKGGYIGKVADDSVGESFIKSLKDLGVEYETSPLTESTATGRCMIFVTPDGQRTMNTFLGAAVELTPDDINADFISRGDVIYLEGYLFDPPQAMEAFIKAARLAHEAGREVAFTLSDSFCVDRHREAFQDFIDYHVDILFANEDELKSLYETDSLEEAISRVEDHCSLAAVTRSENGSIIIQDNNKTRVKAETVENVVDSTGAGDAYAAGFLFGYTQGKDMAECGRLGSIAAAEIISHMGPRPEANLADLVNQKKAA